MSKAKSIGTALYDRLSEITIANGYSTDIGLNVYRGRTTIDESRIPCVIIAEVDDLSKDSVSHGTEVLVDQKYVIEAHVVCNPDHPNDRAHDVIADLKRAVFKDKGFPSNTMGVFSKDVRKVTYGGKTIGPRPDGASFVSGSITIIATFMDNLREP